METRRFQIYKCPVCDTVVEVLHQWSMELVCCGPAMVAVRAKTRRDDGWADHAPTIQDTPGGCRVAIGGSHHPVAGLPDRRCSGCRVAIGGSHHTMTKSHRIEWIELVADGRSHRQFLAPGQPASVVFAVKPAIAAVRAYCTVHGLWQSQIPIPKAAQSPKSG